MIKYLVVLEGYQRILNIIALHLKITVTVEIFLGLSTKITAYVK